MNTGTDAGGARARIGLLMAGDRSYPAYTAFMRELATLGHDPDLVEARFAEGPHDRLPALAGEIVAMGPDVLAVIGAVSAFAARAVAPDLPTVFAVVVDPVAARLVPDAARPGGTMTGTTSFDPKQAREQVRLLRACLPGVRRIGVLGDAGVPRLLAEGAAQAADAEGLRGHLRLLSGPDDIVPSIAAFLRDEVDALLVLEVPRTSTHAATIAEVALEARLPTVFGRDLAQAGPMLAYGTSFATAAERMAVMVDRILKGEPAGTIPVESVVLPELVVNRRVARELGVAIPREVLARATEIRD